MAEKDAPHITDEIATGETAAILPAEWLAPETEAEPQPRPKYNPDDPEFKKAVVAVVLEMKRKRVI